MGQEPSQIRQEIEETRAEMGDTVDALAYKADVKTRMKESISDKRDRLKEQIQGTTHKVGEATPDGQQVKEGMPPAPEQTVETVKEDVQWAKSQAKSARR